MNILGISCYYHDAAACLIIDGKVIAAAQEERFTRKKHDPSFPHEAIKYCLAEGNIETADLDYVAFYDKPILKFERLLEGYLGYAPAGLASFIQSMPLWLKKKLWIPDLIGKELDWGGTILFPDHHESHAASAFYPSPFDRAAFLTIDGVGEWATTSWGVASGNKFDITHEVHFPHSLGLLYSAFTYFTGFKVNSGEYKLMGLAPYGEPKYIDLIKDNLIDIKPDGSYRLNMDYFDYVAGLRMTGKKMETLFGRSRRKEESPLTQDDMDIARSIQVVTEEVVLKMAEHIYQETGEKNLCLAGGVALNCVANGRLLRESSFDNIWVQPAAGDAGGALGSAMMVWYQYLNNERNPDWQFDNQSGSLLGPSFSDEEIRSFLDEDNHPYEHIGFDKLPEKVAELLSEGKIAGWFQGRMEFGPRALGNRSVIADPRGQETQRRVNLKIKFRESFRPFAPSVLAERAGEYFDIETESPYMLMVAPVKNATITGTGFDRLKHVESPVSSVTHVDGSARIQTVHKEINPIYHRLLSAFEAKTGCPVLVNTSFNVRGEPIVHTPADAWQCFVNTHMDFLVLGSFIITKDMLPEDQRSALSAEEIAAQYGLD